MAHVILLDVSHGNCAVVRSGDLTAVIDCPTGTVLLDTLRDINVTTIEAAFISHADKDHIAGILSILTSNNIQVRRIYVNPDSQKASKIWRDFRVAVAVAERKGICEVVPVLSTVIPGIVPVGEAKIIVLCPTASLALTGVGGTTPSGNVISSNGLSGVLRIEADNSGRGVLLAGDMDDVALAEALAADVDLSADVLVFPHHGGLPGTADANDFTIRLLDAVGADTVVFSNGRGRHDNPRGEIVKTVRERACSIACTQLSERCQAKTVDAAPYLEPLRASGRRSSACCAGSLTFELSPRPHRSPAHAAQHQNFITDKVETPMCR